LIKNNYNRTFLILFIFTINIFNGEICGQASKTAFEVGVIYLSEFIAEEKFGSSSTNDLEKIDLIYLTALDLYNGDISEALLALTFATLPFNKMPIKLPIINLRIQLRLPSVNEELFIMKRKNIPGQVYFDSKISGGQDKDKVAHFFGNAFLANNISLFNASKFLGLFVEMFESAFKVSGGIDFRDLQTNHLGEFFGSSLKNNPTLRPSDFFNVYSLFYFSYN